MLNELRHADEAVKLFFDSNVHFPGKWAFKIGSSELDLFQAKAADSSPYVRNSARRKLQQGKLTIFTEMYRR